MDIAWVYIGAIDELARLFKVVALTSGQSYTYPSASLSTQKNDEKSINESRQLSANGSWPYSWLLGRTSGNSVGQKLEITLQITMAKKWTNIPKICFLSLVSLVVLSWYLNVSRSEAGDHISYNRIYTFKSPLKLVVPLQRLLNNQTWHGAGKTKII